MICANIFRIIIISNIAVIDTETGCVCTVSSARIYVKEVKKTLYFKVSMGHIFPTSSILFMELFGKAFFSIWNNETNRKKETKITSFPTDSPWQMISFMNSNEIRNRGDCSLWAHFNFAFSLAPIIKDGFIDHQTNRINYKITNQSKHFITGKNI